MAKRNGKNNYLNLALILIGVIFVTLAGSNLYKNHLKNRANNSYIAKYVANIQPNEIQNASLEFSPDTFLFISYTGNQDIYNFEVKLKKVLKDNELINNFIYMNITELMKQDNYLTNLNKTLGLEKNTLKELPGIIYFKDNKAVDLIDSNSSLINTSDFIQLLEKYEIID